MVQNIYLTSSFRFLLVMNSHGVAPVDPTEPSFVATKIFKDRASFESWVKKAAAGPSFSETTQKRPPEAVYYEGTLVISSGTL